VTCHFQNGNTVDTNGIQHEKTYAERLATADVALRRVNSVLVNNKDVAAPPFIRARVTIRGSIILTTSNDQNNVVYEHYTTIITDALSYYAVCEQVEIGKHFSQFCYRASRLISHSPKFLTVMPQTTRSSSRVRHHVG